MCFCCWEFLLRREPLPRPCLFVVSGHVTHLPLIGLVGPSDPLLHPRSRDPVGLVCFTLSDMNSYCQGSHARWRVPRLRKSGAVPIKRVPNVAGSLRSYSKNHRAHTCIGARSLQLLFWGRGEIHMCQKLRTALVLQETIESGSDPALIEQTSRSSANCHPGPVENVWSDRRRKKRELFGSGKGQLSYAKLRPRHRIGMSHASFEREAHGL